MKLTEDQWKEILSEWAVRTTHKSLAAKYNTTTKAIAVGLARRKKKHIASTKVDVIPNESEAV